MYHSEETRWDVGVESPLVVTKLAWARRPSRLRFQITRVGHGIAWGTARPTLVARVMTTYDHVGLSSEASTGHIDNAACILLNLILYVIGKFL